MARPRDTRTSHIFAHGITLNGPSVGPHGFSTDEEFLSDFGALFAGRLEQAGYNVEKVESAQAAHTPLGLQLTITSVAWRYSLFGCGGWSYILATSEVDATVDLYDHGKSLGSHAYHGQNTGCHAPEPLAPTPESLSAAVQNFLNKAVPEVTASLSVLKPNASQGATTPPSASTSSVSRKQIAGCATKGAMAAVTLELPILQVGDISAFYVSVANSRPTNVSLFNDFDFPPLDSITLLQPHAIGQSGGHVEALSVDQAIEKAGGIDELRAALFFRHRRVHLGEGEYREVTRLFSGTVVENAAVGCGLGLLGEPCGIGKVDAPFAEFEFSGGESEPESQYMYLEATSRCPGPACKKVYLEPQGWEKGYLFFTRGNYTALEITVEDCDQKGCRTPSQSETLQCKFNFTFREGW
jgi:hypothetical protein